MLTGADQNATQKVDSIVAENPDQTLDQLLAARKINQDQKAQAQKKPALQASLAQLEEQVAQYKQFDEDYQKRLATEKAALETFHKDELDKVKEAASSAAKAEGAKEAKDNLLALSKFLRAAAAKRQGGDETSPENRAFEGALLLVYGGEAAAVAAIPYCCGSRTMLTASGKTSKSASSHLNTLLTLRKRHGPKTSHSQNPHRPPLRSQALPRLAQTLPRPMPD